MMLSGAIAGLAGAEQVLGVYGAFYDNFSPGYGFDGIAVAMLANFNPIGVILAAFLFGALNSGQRRAADDDRDQQISRPGAAIHHRAECWRRSFPGGWLSRRWTPATARIRRVGRLDEPRPTRSRGGLTWISEILHSDRPHLDAADRSRRWAGCSPIRPACSTSRSTAS